MKIYYIGRFHPSFRTEVYVSHALQLVPDVQLQKKQYVSGVSLRHLVTDIQRHKPDVVLFSKLSLPCARGLIDWCRGHKILTVTWLWDLFWGYRSQRPGVFHADILLTTDGGHDKQWESIRANHRVLRQGIHLPEATILPRSTEEPSYRVAFFGHAEGYRRELIRTLSKLPGFIRHTGKRGMALNQAIAQADVVVGDSYPATNYWSNRIYEMLGRGAFLIHPHIPELDSEFTEGVHYVGFDRKTFQTSGELKEKIQYYLDHPDEAEQIRLAGHERCKQHFTYEHRVAQLLDEHIRPALL